MDEIGTAELLGRIDERTKNTEQGVHRLDLKMDSFVARISKLETDVESLVPVKHVVFAAVGLILIAVLGALITLVVFRPN